MTAGVLKAHAIAERRRSARDVPDELAAAQAAPGPEQERDPEEAQDQTGGPGRCRVLVAHAGQAQGENPERRGGVPEAGDYRRGVLFAVGEERPGDRAAARVLAPALRADSVDARE